MQADCCRGREEAPEGASGRGGRFWDKGQAACFPATCPATAASSSHCFPYHSSGVGNEFKMILP